MAIIWDDSFKSCGGGRFTNDRHDKDILIDVKKYGTKIVDKIVCFFNHGEEDVNKITKYGYMHVGEDTEKGRLYFDEDPLKKDRRVNLYKTYNNKEYPYITLGYSHAFIGWQGSYDLLYDEVEGLYYIEKGET